MSLKRRTVHADSEDLAIIKEAAAREGIAEAEIIREAIHLAALAKRTWDEPLDWPSFHSGADASASLEQIWDEKGEAYRRSKQAQP